MAVANPFLAGQEITAASLAFVIPLFAYKAAQTSVTSSTVLAADPDLSVAVAASGVYEVEMLLLNCSGGASGGLKFAFTVPAASGGDYAVLANNLGGSDSIIDAGAWTAVSTANPNNGLLVKGTLATGAAAGSLALTWAQNSSNATATVVGAYSYLRARQVA